MEVVATGNLPEGPEMWRHSKTLDAEWSTCVHLCMRTRPVERPRIQEVCDSHFPQEDATKVMQGRFGNNNDNDNDDN